jgi:formate hydrogenlyase subunit 4
VPTFGGDGQRPAQGANALQWKHIYDRFILFEQAITISTKGLALKSGLKTQPQRRFPVNQQLRDILKAMRPEGCDPETHAGALSLYLPVAVASVLSVLANVIPSSAARRGA